MHNYDSLKIEHAQGGANTDEQVEVTQLHGPPHAAHTFVPKALTPEEVKLQAKMQKKVDTDLKAMRAKHPDIETRSSPGPEVILGAANIKYEDAHYEYKNGSDRATIHMSVDLAKNKQVRDFVAAHEAVHDFKVVGTSEALADVMAAEVIGPEKAIKSIHAMHKIMPEGDLAGLDSSYHGSWTEREQAVKLAFPEKNLKIPKHKIKTPNMP